MKIYIAGPMRGLPLYNWPAFEAEARSLRSSGHEVVSPTEIDEKHGVVEVDRDPDGTVTDVRLSEGFDFEKVLARDLEAVRLCDSIQLLPGWECSEGAQRELDVACKYGLQVSHAAPYKVSETLIVDPRTGGAKGSKPCQLGWVAPAGLKALGEVAGFGSSKYAPTNYRKGYKHSLSFNAMLRHVQAYLDGEDTDPESGLPHLAHAGWHCMTLVQLAKDHPELDDRFGHPAAEGEV